MQFTVEFQADHLSRVMEAVRREVATPEEMLGSIGESLFRVNQERHDQGLDPEGKPWAELADSTKAAGERKGGPLNRTGRMLKNFHYQAAGDTLRLGFDAGDGFPAVFHQDGSEPHIIRPRKAKALAFGGVFRQRVNHPGLPARRLVGFPESDQQLVADVTADHLSLVLNSVR
jgi:phage gpG-like protein